MYWREPKGRGGGEYSRKFIRRGSSPRSNLLPQRFYRYIPILTENVPLSYMSCNNKTAKNKDSSISDISNGQAVLLQGTVQQQDLDTVITIKVPL